MQDNPFKFSVLMSVYYKEHPQYFDRAMRSIWHEQNIKPNEIVLVKDGWLTDELNQSIDNWTEILKDVLKIINLKQNVGLGDALNIGLKQCSFDLVARMDTDDISLPDRFKRQLNIFEDQNIGVCGSWVGEFENDESKIISYRKVPEQHNEIILFAKTRNPFNHVSVMYKKSLILSVGGYKKRYHFEDYYLWARVITKGIYCINIPKPLVSVRAGACMIDRRGNLNYAIHEIKLQYEFLIMKFISPYIFIKNLIIRIPVRLLPNSFRSFVYQLIRR